MCPSSLTRMTDAGESTQDPISAAVAPGYAFDGPALELGGLMVDATTLSGVPIKIPLGMLNRHGLVAGATGTGKTKTLQLLAEQLSAAGVPVFAADIKGDLSGLSVPGEENPKVTERATSLGQDWQAAGLPGGVLRARWPGHRYAAAGHDERLRPHAALQGARPQRHPGVLAGAGLPLRRQGRPPAAGPGRPARGREVPDLRRGQGRPQGPRWPLQRHGRGDPARADRLLRPGCRRVLRRARVRDQRLPADHARRGGPDLAGRAAQPAWTDPRSSRRS